ncbi:microcompartment protein CcmK/EutM [Ereboglobus sp. PH5-5]|uniref:EutN/CcmL family microcompartment protein n=1 Tax=Ereboglobus sp. PH5-5 TaxID=2940529 RepID=UPI0024075FBD|nr:EutN/CcmL family microcompartment protein [Ereboglobus sp. PH5-5]MDF9833983.1 microcompartment protein CcmK/EutM [Ereboglobus sp. PH5-5]
MNLARIDGTIIAPACHPSMRGTRTVICQPLDENGNDIGNPVLAIDTLGAGLHQRVLISTDGSRTREIVRDKHSPLRNHILGVVDDAKENSKFQ